MATEETTGSSDATRGEPAKKSAKKPAKKAAKKSAPRASSPKSPSGSQVAARAASQLLELTGREAEGVTGLERSDHGWRVQVEVVEIRRIPDTTDVLALYEVDVDSRGDLQGYRRLRRYSRGAAREE